MNNLKTLLESIDTEINTFKKESTVNIEKLNKAAGTRARKSSLLITSLLKKYRVESVKTDKTI